MGLKGNIEEETFDTMRPKPLFNQSQSRQGSRSGFRLSWNVFLTLVIGVAVIAPCAFLYKQHRSRLHSAEEAVKIQRQQVPKDEARTRFEHLQEASKTEMSTIPLAAEVAKKLRVVVVGGGLAGCAAALSAYNQSISMGVDVHVVIVDKMPKLVSGAGAQAKNTPFPATNIT